MNSFIIHGDICYAADKNTLVTRENGYLVCVDGICKGVFGTVPEQYAHLELREYGGMLVIPGMVDLHIHAPQYAYRGLGMDKELLDWLNTYAFPEESKYSNLNYADKAYTIFTDAIKRSATTRLVVFGTLHREATELLMDKLDKSGMVSYVGKVNMDRNSPDNLREVSAAESLADTERFILNTQHKYKNTAPIITPRFTPSCSDELMRGLGELSKKYGVRVQSHLSENPGEVEWVRELCPWAENYGEAYDRFGLFGKPQKTVMAHCVYSDDNEIARMKENGVFIAHCPASNTNVASGIAPMRKYLELDMNLGLGSDVAGGHSESMFTAMVDALQVSRLYWRLVDQSKKPLNVTEVFYLATKGGGAFFGKVGSFEEGYECDVVILNDSLLPHPQGLSLQERLERAIYLGGDVKAMEAKYCRGNVIIRN
ncbi:amidohydrolase family protein [Ruminococcus difficilis]|uniref:Amidohydrolase family protein n=1 Tax=Ruminococcus difficilis TaxID=2763069 RepID=A0A934U3D9_9FIRM|nr:amidohydrolase family protein [Ruminococcus difficilis]MBK6087684.1 amidohydrolase family protein [Ruminococcus difficilis]